jgi:putative membrane protein
MDEDERVNPEDSARMRDLLASNRTLLAWIRTAISFAGLGFVVAKFGLFLDEARGVAQAREAASVSLVRFSGFLGILMVLLGLLLTIIGFVQHQSTVAQEQVLPGSPQPARWPVVVATACCALACALLAIYLIITPT